MQLNAIKFGLAAGITTSIITVIRTLMGFFTMFKISRVQSMVKQTTVLQDPKIGPQLLNFSTILVTVIFAATFAFVCALVIGWLFARIYNKLVKVK